MLGWLVLGFVVVVIATLVLARQRRPRDAGRLTKRPANPFAAVTIRPSLESPCEAVLKLQEQRFLALRAPALPVPGCDRKRCECRYVRHADRRAATDRRDAFARFGGLLPNARGERRSPRDRRKSRSTPR